MSSEKIYLRQLFPAEPVSFLTESQSFVIKLFQIPDDLPGPAVTFDDAYAQLFRFVDRMAKGPQNISR
jgi:hypothetical protein